MRLEIEFRFRTDPEGKVRRLVATGETVKREKVLDYFARRYKGIILRIVEATEEPEVSASPELVAEVINHLHESALTAGWRSHG